MKVYLDMCSIQRPLDSQDDIRVATEAQAVLGVLRLCEAGHVTLVGSDALLFELEKNPHPIRKDCDDRLLKRARAAETGQTRVVSPLELVTEVSR